MLTCRFCGGPGPLRNSHIVSKWAYKRTLSKRSGYPQPFLVTGGNIVLSAEQLTDKLLCSACEQKFGICENYVARLAYR